ncbi:parallel beta-helix domain-containing protein [Metapseudomonas otitidis]|uniref:mannuronan 5-epimerase n=1 Tax=Metapseudomonas otitidis TaxID=319939 RepID=A0A1I0UAV3_9GAMM|nr:MULTISPECIES: parallel beta-helix domain-containing protein [Pseudomonas]MDL5594506.1 parallel beta-helix domain-containing protein [Bacillus subtilis]MCO7553581.1 right-handed parallel beta-helix repeat-containing protein [Pseudomonas otitidis]MCP1619995.1 parallel beta-helix repeat protein [Pseudomonas otitidis]MDG9784831.1 right-handed parallel beta-helix repeat-containing protein [Pseudomonas otitidis]MDI6527231.1 parallel beta-helix domain-containing protein [Pseudomonas otitidis]
MRIAPLSLLALSLVLAACGEQDKAPTTHADFQKDLQARLIKAKPGTVIEIPAGTYQLDRSLSLKVSGVTLKGAGMDKTILNFKGQKAGAEGLLVDASDFTIEDLALEDTKGDALKVVGGKNIVIRNVRTEWTNGPATENGAYGIYPVQTENTLIEGAVAIGASDAGIYVGQSRNVVVRNSRAERNVAGIEIENTIGADVYDNVATGNTGGILVFNMPNLQQPGHGTRVYRNQVKDNDHDNFGHKGTPVASVPAGSGVVINSNDDVEIFDNDIGGHRTANVIVSSYFSTGYTNLSTSESFDPYPERIYIHGNRFGPGGDSPDNLELKALKLAKFGLNGRLPDILWDGYVNPAKRVDGKLPAELGICVDNGEATLINVDGPNGYKNISTDMSAHRCTLPRLPEIVLGTPAKAPGA